MALGQIVQGGLDHVWGEERRVGLGVAGGHELRRAASLGARLIEHGEELHYDGVQLGLDPRISCLNLNFKMKT